MAKKPGISRTPVRKSASAGASRPPARARRPGTQPASEPLAAVPDLGFRHVPSSFRLPEGLNFGPCSAVAVNSKGNVLVFNRGPQCLVEFDRKGRYLRSMCHGIFSRPHGLRVDADDNIWATDIGSHIVIKFDRRGRILMVLGGKDSPGEFHPFGHLRLFDEPNDVAFGPKGEIYVCQGHGKGESRVVKFEADGTYVGTWGGEGGAPGQFRQPHSVAVDGEGRLHVADRSNQRIQVFDADGRYLRESGHPGTPCGLAMTRDRRHMYLAHGHTGRIMKIDLEGNVLGGTGGQGKGLGRYGEAHYLALNRKEDTIYVADTLNWCVQTLVKTG